MEDLSENTKSAYDAIASGYKDYSSKKKSYLQSIENLVVKNSNMGGSIMDIGSGDGRRLSKIKKLLRSPKCLLIEPSHEMAKISRLKYGFEVHEILAEEIEYSDVGSFDNIFALWNVFGHINSKSMRLKALGNIKKCMKPGSKLILDINNRHNINSYGFFKVIFRVFIDFLFFDEKRGDAQYKWIINNKSYEGFGHLFTPKEIETLFKKIDLKIIKRYSVDYKSGAISKSIYKGQLLYIIEI